MKIRNHSDRDVYCFLYRSFDRFASGVSIQDILPVRAYLAPQVKKGHSETYHPHNYVGSWYTGWKKHDSYCVALFKSGSDEFFKHYLRNNGHKLAAAILSAGDPSKGVASQVITEFIYNEFIKKDEIDGLLGFQCHIKDGDGWVIFNGKSEITQGGNK